jgi:glycosyltransferase involved in cell wall biosynthesis
MRRTRVLMVIENVPLARDHRLRKQAAALLAEQCAVTVICRADPRNKTCVPGVRVLQYPAPREGSSLLAFAAEYLYSVTMAGLFMVWELVRNGFDVLQVASTPDIYFLLALPCRWLRRPVVFDFRDVSPETYEARYGRTDGAAYRTLVMLERCSFRRADRVLVVNESLRKIALTRGGGANERIITVGNGPMSARVLRRAARPELRAGRPHLCCWVGLMGPQDKVDLAVRAVAQLVHVRHRTDCAFAFVGTGESQPAARQLAAELGVADWVSFPGWAEEDLVFDYLCTADLGLEPNLEYYVSPVKVQEYLAAGLPVVAFEAEETVRLAGDAARYAPAGDVGAMARLIDELLDSPKTREQMAQIGQARVRDVVAWEHQARRYTAMFRGLPGADGRPGVRAGSGVFGDDPPEPSGGPVDRGPRRSRLS